MSNFDLTAKAERIEGDEIFSIPIKAGKRIYYFDVKATRGNDYYITVTESRKRLMRDGSFFIDKHKIHLYKEDFEKFAQGLDQAIQYIKQNMPQTTVQDNVGDSFLDEFKQEIPTEEEFFSDVTDSK